MDLQKTIDHKKEALVQIQNESMSNLKPASVLMEQRIKELTQLDRELRMLEGNPNETEVDDEENEGGLSYND